jgi:hypothetical protein
MRAAAAAVSLAGLWACAPGPVVLQVPFEAADRAAVVAVESEVVSEIHALDAEDRELQPVLRSINGWSPGERVAVSALFYPQPLAALDIPAGLLESVEGGAPLPAEARGRQAVLESSDRIHWAALERRPPLLDALRLPRSTPCRSLASDPARLFLADDEVLVGLVRDVAGRLWVVLQAGVDGHARFREVSTSGALGPAVEPGLGLRPQVAVNDRAGHVYLGGGQLGGASKVLVGGPAEGFTLVAEAPARLSAQWPRHLALDEGGAIYALSREGEVSRFEAGQVTPVATLTGLGEGGALTWGDGGLWAVQTNGRAVVRVVDGVVSPVATAVDQAVEEGRDRLSTVAVIPGLGTFLGTDGGVLLRLEGAAFAVAEPNTLIDSTIEAMIPYGDGMVVVGRYGIVDQLYDGEGYCAERRVFVGMNTTLRHVVETPDALVVAGVERQAEALPGFVAFVRPGL